MGLPLTRLVAAESTSAAGLAPRADSCILLFLNGGPSHLDMWKVRQPPVRADQADAIPRPDIECDVPENRLGVELTREVSGGEQDHSVCERLRVRASLNRSGRSGSSEVLPPPPVWAKRATKSCRLTGLFGRS